MGDGGCRDPAGTEEGTDVTTLREVMSRHPATVAPDATVAEAAKRMVRGRFGSVLVKVEGEVVGILTERDVLRAAGTDGDLLTTSVGDWMTPDPTTAPADQDTSEAVEEMLASGFRHLPVTDGGDIVGIVSLRDLLDPRGDRAAPRAAPTPPEPAEPPERPKQAEARPAEGSTPAGGATPESTPEQVHDRREQMFEATRLLQRRSRPPEADADPAEWRSELREVVAHVDEVVSAHVASTEATGGFFDELVTESGGRLSAAVRRLRRDHERSTEMIRDLRAAIDDGSDTDSLHEAAAGLFAQLEAHRHRGNDMLWQAYGVEIGGGD